MKYFAFPALLASLLLTQCRKADLAPVDQLPPATQTGANTFGCLVNGQVWLPKGYNGYTNYSVSYDPTYAKGTLNVGCYRYIGTGANDFQTIGFFSDSLPSVGAYSLTRPRHREGTFRDLTKGTCQFPSNDSYYRRGVLTITRLDRAAGVVSGTFAFTLWQPGCDSVRVTDGRFDRQL